VQGNAVEEGIAGKLAGDLASRGSAHAVADNKDAVLRQRGAGVLIALALATAIGEHGEDRRGRRLQCPLRTRRNGWGLRLALLQRCDICHFSTPDKQIAGS